MNEAVKICIKHKHISTVLCSYHVILLCLILNYACSRSVYLGLPLLELTYFMS